MESIYQEAITFKAWVDGREPFLPVLDQLDRPDLLPRDHDWQHAREVLRSASLTMMLIAPGRKEIRVGLEKMPKAPDQRRLPDRTASGHAVSYHLLSSPRIALPRAGVNISPKIGLHAGRYPCGSSISVATEPATGTLGCLVRIDGMLYGLTANHVSGLCHHTAPDMPIMGPGSMDVRPGNLDPAVIGHHVTCAPWHSGKESNTQIAGNLDIAVFRIKSDDEVSSYQGNAYDTPIAVAKTSQIMASENVKVWKVGRTTSLTNGQLFGHIAGGVQVRFKEKLFTSIVHFDDLLVVRSGNEKFATEGDSGSLVVWRKDGQIEAVGILFCTSSNDDAAYLMPMEAVLGHFGATLVGGHNVQARSHGSSTASSGAIRP